MRNLLITLCLPLGFGCSQMLNSLHSEPEQVEQDNAAQLVSEQRAVKAPVPNEALFQCMYTLQKF